jgi:hypothetical protein
MKGDLGGAALVQAWTQLCAIQTPQLPAPNLVLPVRAVWHTVAEQEKWQTIEELKALEVCVWTVYRGPVGVGLSGVNVALDIGAQQDIVHIWELSSMR